VDHGDRKQGAGCLHPQARPSDQNDLRLTDDDALPTRSERVFKRSGDLVLCCFLAFGLRR